MSQPKRYLITSALPYANGPLHIGHMAGAYLPADIYVRYLRSMGRDVAFICGSDEHGAAILLRAKKEGISPQEIVDKYHAIIKKAFEDFGISFNIYHRTSAELHHETAAAYFKKLYEQDVFEVRESEQYYDEAYNQFLADRFITGTCPKCSYEHAYGDQCENCGSSLSPKELINPVSTLSESKPVLKKTKHWYLPLNKYSDWLKEWLIKGEGRTEKWKKNVSGQVGSWIEDGLLPRAMTRDLDWGVKVPLPDADGKVLYVWLDAPIGYISATKQWAADNGKDWKPYWQDEETKLLHFIGKDNIVFHCIIFPSLLKAHGDFILPTNVPANEFMNMEGDKMSTSRNWAVWLHQFIEDHPGKQDVLRYVLCANFPETKDSEFTWKDYQTRNNSELVATFGNFVNRVLVLTDKYFDGVVPKADLDRNMAAPVKDGEPIDYTELSAVIAAKVTDCSAAIESYNFREAQRQMMELAGLGNAFLQFNEPWKQIKTDPEQVKTILFSALQIVGALSVLCEPFLPFSSSKMREMLALPTVTEGELERLIDTLAELPPQLVPMDHQLGKSALLFERIDDEVIAAELAKLEAIKASASSETTSTERALPAFKDTIQYEDFAKLDIRTGTVLDAKPVKKADKLLELTVDLGLEKRTIVSGIALQFKPEELINRRVVVLANLAPRKLRGVESQGMILMAENEEGTLSFVASGEDMPNGSQVS